MLKLMSLKVTVPVLVIALSLQGLNLAPASAAQEATKADSSQTINVEKQDELAMNSAPTATEKDVQSNQSDSAVKIKLRKELGSGSYISDIPISAY
jgi:hypothetical protein